MLHTTCDATSLSLHRLAHNSIHLGCLMCKTVSIKVWTNDFNTPLCPLCIFAWHVAGKAYIALKFMGGTRLKSESWKVTVHTKNAPQSHLYYFPEISQSCTRTVAWKVPPTEDFETTANTQTYTACFTMCLPVSVYPSACLFSCPHPHVAGVLLTLSSWSIMMSLRLSVDTATASCCWTSSNCESVIQSVNQ